LSDNFMEELVKDMNSEMKEMHSKIGNIQGRIESIEGKIGSIEGRIENIQGQIGSIEGKIGNIQGQIETNSKWFWGLLVPSLVSIVYFLYKAVYILGQLKVVSK